MKPTIDKYLARKVDFDHWPLEGDRGVGATQVVVIPALAEADSLPETLDSLARNPADELDSTLVIVVVNNRSPGHANSADMESNQATLDELRSRHEHSLRLAWIDAASPGRELPPKGGVGDARKIGLDHGLRLLSEMDVMRNALVCLDADTHVEPTYLQAIRAHFSRDGAWGATIPFAHRMEGGREQRQAILQYEAHLRYYVLGLRRAESPYAFHTVGSAMACSAEAYAAIGGMKKRQAAEDFYFLQHLAKTGPVAEVTGTTVHPSSRTSHRVPFGTGAHLHSGAAIGQLDTYAPKSFEVLRSWLALWNEHREHDGEALLSRAHRTHVELAAYLEAEGFASAWDKLRSNGQANRGYCWFDGLKTLRLVHHLRDTSYPTVPLVEALHILPQWFGIDAPGSSASWDQSGAICTSTLDALRDLELAVGFNCADGRH